MTAKPPITSAEIDPLVRTFLDWEASGVDAPRLHAQILGRRAQAHDGEESNAADDFAPQRQVGRVGSARFAWRLTAAACLALVAGLFGYFALSPEPASAYALVRDAESMLSKKTDRCYRIETQVPKAWLKTSPFLQSGDETLLWTRGNRFCVTTVRGERKMVWGQDEQRRLWISGDEHLGLEFEHDDVPSTFARARAYLGLDVRRLAGRFLQQFDLRIEGRTREVVVVQATAKIDRPSLPFNSARLEIERSTRTIRRMELTRSVEGTVKGQFVFTLVDERPQPPSIYELKSHLAAGAEILNVDAATRRSEMLRQLMSNWR